MPRVPVPSGPLPEGPGDEPGYQALGAGDPLPWPVRTVVDEREVRWVAHHYVYLGIFRHAGAGAELLNLLRARPDDPDRQETGLPADLERSSGEGCLAALAADHRGTPIGRTFVLASLPWALGRLRAGAQLRGFQAANAKAGAAFAGRWRAEAPDDPEEPGEPADDVVLSPADLVAEIAAIAAQIGSALA